MPQDISKWKPVDESASAWKPVDEPPAEKPAAASAPASTWMDTLSSYLPSRRTALQAGGAMVGGVLGIPEGGPFGAAAGGALGAGAGESLDQLIGRFRGESQTPQTSNEAARRIGNGMTLGAAQEGAGAVIPDLARSAARGLYRNALKPSTILRPDKAANLVETGLRERLPVKASGVGKLDRAVSGINDQIDTSIARNPAAPLSPTDVASHADPAIQRFQYRDLQGDAGAAAGEKQRFLTEHSTPVQYSPFNPSQGEVPPIQTYRMETPIPAARAQEMKKGIWQELAANDFGKTAPGYKEARKSIGSGLREGLEQNFPNIRGLNAQEGNLLELRPHLERAANRIANNNSMGIDAPLTAGAMQAVTGSKPLSIMAALAKTLPGSRTAILLNRLANPMAASKLILPYVADRSRAGN